MDLSSALKELFSILIAGLAFPGFNLHIKPGLYPVGNPTEEAPILVTSNYYVTYKRVITSLKKQSIKAWILVVDTKGVNVWCSAAGGNFTAEKVISQIDDCNLSESVNHKNLILPQLSAAGIDHLILKKAGWEAKFGPIDINDLGEYQLNEYQKTPKMSQIVFPIQKRIEYSISHNCFISLILLPLILLVDILAHPIAFLRPWADWLVPNMIFLLIYIWIFGFLYGILYPIIPFKSGFLKGLIISIVFVPVSAFLFFSDSTLDLFMGVSTLLFYNAAISTDFDGFTPLSGIDLFEKDLILLTIFSVIIVLSLIIAPLLL
jgi:hypothetical protein